MRKMVAFMLLALAACNTPGPDFRDVAATRIKIDQSVFDVRVRGVRAQAIRLNAENAPRLAAVGPRGVYAIEKVSGCRVRRLDGDAAVMLAWLDCGQPLQPLPPSIEYECWLDWVYDRFADLTCEPV